MTFKKIEQDFEDWDKERHDTDKLEKDCRYVKGKSKRLIVGINTAKELRTENFKRFGIIQG